MDGTHEYEPDDVFYAVETAADAAADEVLEQDALLRELLNPTPPQPEELT